MFVCGPLDVVAYVHNADGDISGRLLAASGWDGVARRWVASSSDIFGRGVELASYLDGKRVHVSSGDAARRQLSAYLTESRPSAYVRQVTQPGWHCGAYVTPSGDVLGNPDELLFYDPPKAAKAHFAQSGTQESWQRNIARFGRGNPRLMFAISSAFAGPLVGVAGVSSGGFNFYGSSSIGKTTLARAAVSVFGAPSYMQSCRATDNALEAVASEHNDALLVLDEVGQMDAHAVGEVAYMLGNGEGKRRADRSGDAREARAWRLVFLMTGEVALAQHMASAGKRVRAGQEVRMIDIDANAGQGRGVFDELHGYKGGAELSAEIVDGARSNYGVAGRQFIEWIAADRDGICRRTSREIRKFVTENTPDGADGQVLRSLERFALVGVAGELATEAGITGWPSGESLEAASACFRSWLEDRGGSGSGEAAAILRQVRAFFEAHGESRFTNLDDAESRPTINRAGYRKRVVAESGEPVSAVQHWVLPSVFERELCDGYSPKVVREVLRAHGWISIDSGGKATKPQRIPGEARRMRVYVFTDAMWGGE